MRRRTFITLIGGVVTAWPFGASAQQSPMPVVGFLHLGSPGPSAPEVAEFRKGLSETGYVEARNVTVEYRWAEGQIDQLPDLALDLARRVSVIVAASLPAVNAVRATNSDIPVVFEIGGDPVKLGLVESLNKPGRNFTGFTEWGNLLAPKQLEVLHEAVPKALKIGMLINPANPNSTLDVAAVRAGSQALGLQLIAKEVRGENDVEPTFADLSRNEVGALLISKTMSLGRISNQVIAYAAQNPIPAIYAWREDVIGGGLMAYANDDREMYRQIGTYVGRILRGKKPAELPVQQPTKVQLIVNLKTAKALGLTLPLTLLGRADEVIE